MLVLFHIDDFMLAGRKWEELQRRMHNKWELSEWEKGRLVDVSQLQDGSFVMAYVDSIDPADIKSERGKTPEASVTEQADPGYEVSQEPCNGRAHRRTQKEHAPCKCYNRRFQQQQLSR